ncbi:hypothetical protein CEP52_012593 [Fusarium oligoseptatum]|uniref:RING-type domain-containing protein n=1 Tax=Fusarium oligoseptatum TaxID=2604345 RepID=A0A428SXF2_9HYPO|nr:hypothetical protein CEP52_012593 [Fusarium oligoseptatum]
MPPITDTFWPSLKAQLLRPDSTVSNCCISCTICYENVDLGSAAAAATHESAHTAVVLPCGHIFGSSCLAFWQQSLVDRGQDPSCPTCRLVTIHEGCKHPVRPLYIPLENRQSANDALGNTTTTTTTTTKVEKSVRSFVKAVDGFLDTATTKQKRREAFSRVPPTIPEGGVLNNLCSCCYVEDAIRTLTSLIYSIPDHLSANLAEDEFVGAAATVGNGMWILCSRERRRLATIRKGIEQVEGDLDGCRQLERIIEADSCSRWLGMDLKGITFCFKIYAWE